jgi:hypothetical protein
MHNLACRCLRTCEIAHDLSLLYLFLLLLLSRVLRRALRLVLLLYYECFLKHRIEIFHAFRIVALIFTEEWVGTFTLAVQDTPKS